MMPASINSYSELSLVGNDLLTRAIQHLRENTFWAQWFLNIVLVGMTVGSRIYQKQAQDLRSASTTST